VWLLPIVWMVSLALQPNDMLARTTSNVAWGLIPWPFTIDNLAYVLSQGMTPRWFLNSGIVAVSMTLLVLALSARWPATPSRGSRSRAEGCSTRWCWPGW
jgi:multiple sugar transport system permease protein